MSIELKPCPFCGSQPSVIDGTGRMWPAFQVKCVGRIGDQPCQAEVWPSDTREQAIAAWNTRSAPATEQPDIEMTISEDARTEAHSEINGLEGKCASKDTFCAHDTPETEAEIRAPSAQPTDQPVELFGVLQQEATDCVRACVATLFDVPLAAVPRFDAEGWGDELASWLKPMGFGAINMRFDGTQKEGIPVGFTLGAVASDSLPPPYKHCVVCRDGKVVWCPSYGRDFVLKEVEEYTVIYPLRPCLPERESVTLSEQEKRETI